MRMGRPGTRLSGRIRSKRRDPNAGRQHKKNDSGLLQYCRALHKVSPALRALDTESRARKRLAG